MSQLFPLAPFARPEPLPPPATPGDWAAVLAPGERLLWQGRPDTGFHVRAKHLGPSFAGLIFTPLMAWLLWRAITGAGEYGAPPGAVIALLAAFTAGGLCMIVLPHVMDMLRRRGTHYALTDRRALVDVSLLGRTCHGIGIEAESPIWLARTDPPSVFFGQLPPPPGLLGSMGGPSRRGGPRLVGFELVADAEQVLPLLLAVSKGEA